MLNIAENKTLTLAAVGSWPETVHVFDERCIWAVNAALTAERPLLVSGEPGVGKSQLARAAAKALDRAFIAEVVHARSECHDLQYSFDAVGRLGEAQAMVAAGPEADIGERLNPLRFLTPGALWWTFNFESAESQARVGVTRPSRPETPPGWKAEKGCVLLIDEIDKADADLPNGLLETLGNGAFSVPYLDGPVKMKQGLPPPLVVVTTNEERELPAAFVRRCLVLQMKLPERETELIEWLVQRGAVHFGDKCDQTVRREAAVQLWQDRREAAAKNLQKPGQAEYLDILRALGRLGRDRAEQLRALEKIGEFALKKYPEGY